MAGPEHKPVSPMGGVKAFSCPNCGGQVGLRAPGQTLAAACQHCGSVIDLSDENLRILQRADKKMSRTPVIPLGTRGELDGKEWEVIGFMERKVKGYEYFWEEYLLYNPWYGFRWLINNYGHWGVAVPMMDEPYYNGSISAKYKGKRYKKFSRGGAEVRFVLGEFYWKVKRGDTASTIDLVAPPYMLSYEKDQHGHNWTHTSYVEPKVIQNAFKLEKMPFRRRIGANQPNTARQNLKRILPMFITMLVLAIGLQVYFAGSSRNEEVARAQIQMVNADSSTYVSPPFTLKEGNRNVEIKFNAPSLTNSWVYLEGYLHNKSLNKNFGFDSEWEFYSGRDSDGSWTEGSRSDTKFLNDIPAGQYELVMNFKLASNYNTLDYTVTADVPIFSNFWIILIAISIFPLLLFIRSYMFEQARWEEAD